MKKLKWLFFFLFVLLFCVVAYFVVNNKTNVFDDFIYNMVVFKKNDFLNGFYKFITFFASEIMIIFVSCLIFLIFKNKRYGIFMFLNVLNIFVLNVSLKLIFMRDRPYALMIITESGYSFPSGHAMASLGFYGFIIYLIWQLNLDGRTKKIYTILLAFLIILIGVSRIYLGVHYASDVFAGYLITGAYLILFISFVKKYLKKDGV